MLSRQSKSVTRWRYLAFFAAIPFLTTAAIADEEPLFDGETLNGWTMSDGKPIMRGWEAKDGVIHLKKTEKRAGHIVTQRLFGDFKLTFEWAIAEGGNSGLKYRVRKFGRRLLGCEYQIYDDAKRQLSPRQQSASLYALYEPNEEKLLKPAGEFNSAQIIVAGNRIEHWLNGKRVVAATVGNEDWDQRMAASKFSDIADFARNRFGQIMLTDHGSEAWYRNLKLEPLPIDDLQGDTRLTLGESEFLKSIGRDCQVVRLWPKAKTPDEPARREVAAERFSTVDKKRNRKGLMNIAQVTKPSMLLFRPPPKKNSGAAILLCPGGGYGQLSAAAVNETAQWMNARGITVVMLKYRVPKRNNGHAMNHQPMQDAQRALGILRARSKEWGLHPDKIGVGGFSAGGHLAASLAINHQQRWYDKLDEHDDVSCRPSFAVLLYPAYLTDPILSRTRDPKLHYDRISAESTPPTLISITRPDKFTIGSIEFYLALMEAKIPSELHIYAEGGHGGAIAKYPFGEWAKELQRFLRDQGILDKGEQPEPLTYKGKSLADVEPTEGRTLGDQRLLQILGEDRPLVSVWPEGRGPDETLPSKPEQVSASSRGGNALNVRNVTRPTMIVVRPPEGEGDGRAMIVCPGGGYGGLAAEHEGARVCEWLNGLGVTGILLKYRVPRRNGEHPKHHQALQDLQRAMRVARANAKQWGIDPDRLGVCGFSAGGHLSAALCTNFDKPAYEPIDEIDQHSCRPDFGVLVYPAYLTEPRQSNKVDPLMNALKRNATPPLFMTVARNDVFARGMLNFYLNVREAQVPAEAHVYASGGHGGGIDPISYPSSNWTAACERWLKDLEASEQQRQKKRKAKK